MAMRNGGERAGVMGGNRWFIHSPGSRLDRGPGCSVSGWLVVDAGATGILALSVFGGVAGVSPNGSSEATV